MAISTSNLNFDKICKEIHDSWKNPNQFIQILASLNQFECRKIRETYLNLYGEDPVLVLQKRGAFSSMAEKGLLMLMINSHERDAIVAKEAIHEQNDVNFRALIEIFTCRKSSHVLLIQQAYQARFKRQLDQDIINIEPSHPYQKILMALSASHKAHHQGDVSQHIAKCDARRLYQTGEGKAGAIDEAVVLEILCKRSIQQLKLAFSSYKHIYGHSYINSMENEYSGEFQDALRVTINCICNPSKYFAEALYGSLKGTTKDKDALIRVMVSRSEVDMDEIKRIFKNKYAIELKYAISESIPLSDYRELLLTLATKPSATSSSTFFFSP
ncbi:hypothetical protein M9H77_00944 [Catharanthus roseus]|uniref:Uncharacterized protein n=1 Tax=Catharanthus roseus TaxID=4058 RepID=A0ACC0C444_CATRO|nr:hypothetical protein M9H77_00944 [Catharanthus roseus]